jgi:hypothetical protein
VGVETDAKDRFEAQSSQEGSVKGKDAALAKI